MQGGEQKLLRCMKTMWGLKISSRIYMELLSRGWEVSGPYISITCRNPVGKFGDFVGIFVETRPVVPLTGMPSAVSTLKLWKWRKVRFASVITGPSEASTSLRLFVIAASAAPPCVPPGRLIKTNDADDVAIPDGNDFGSAALTYSFHEMNF